MVEPKSGKKWLLRCKIVIVRRLLSTNHIFRFSGKIEIKNGKRNVKSEKVKCLVIRINLINNYSQARNVRIFSALIVAMLPRANLTRIAVDDQPFLKADHTQETAKNAVNCINNSCRCF